MRKVVFEDSAKNEVAGIISLPRRASSVVILSHEFTSSKDSDIYRALERKLNRLGVGTFRYDYYGHGNSQGALEDITLTKAVGSLKAAVTFARDQGDYSIALLGASFGGLMSLVVVSEDPGIKALVLKSPVTELKSFWRERLRASGQRFTEWRKTGVLDWQYESEDFRLRYSYWADAKRYDTLELAKEIACPVLIVHGDQDTYVPMSQSTGLAEIVDVELRVIEGAEHSYDGPGQMREVKKVMADFLAENLQTC